MNLTINQLTNFSCNYVFIVVFSSCFYKWVYGGPDLKMHPAVWLEEPCFHCKQVVTLCFLEIRIIFL